MARKIRSALPFEERLVLNQYMLSLLGVDSFEALAQPLRDPTLEGLDEHGVSRLHLALVETLPASATLTPDELLAYDQNIVRHTNSINSHRADPIRWKYFQYLALLFAEIYLDRYFHTPEQLLAALNGQVARFNRGQGPGDAVTPYGAVAELTKLAFWMATGAGKTLLMHVNIAQYLHYLAQAQQERELNRILLVTPNEGLSQQHLAELRASGIQAQIFQKDGVRGLFSGRMVEIIEITKLGEESGDKTVAVDAFEGNNLVLVDEGHRGAGGTAWMEMRNRLTADGFSFEYSATFGQAMKAANDAKLTQEYARAVLFDYSYKYFYGDGYGKEYRILNLAADGDGEIRDLYLTAGLLTFYQQLRLYGHEGKTLHPYLLEKPLWIFVGASVNAVRKEQGRDVSDVVDILLFFARFADPNQRGAALARIARLLQGHSGLLNGRNSELFPLEVFRYLVATGLDAEAIYLEVFRYFFNAGGPGRLHVTQLKGSDGEIGLTLGDSDPFGVINVGDAGKLAKLCEEFPELLVAESEFAGSLFQKLDSGDSPVNLLIGSKKFTEGWSSWRVSCMGLMNLGRSEGAQIIQLFGRGVRLRGYGFGLKRSNRVPDVEHPTHVRLLETLNIFGVRADYMAKFQEYLEEEGLPTGENTTTILLPVLIPPIDRRLMTLRIKKGMSFKRQGPIPTLTSEPPAYLQQNRVVIDWYPKVQALLAKGLDRETATTTRQEGKLTAAHVVWLDMDAIFFELVRFKNERAMYNLNLSREAPAGLLARGDWYTLFIPPDDLAFRTMTQVTRWQELAVALLKKYVERFYDYSKDDWERPHLELAPVAETVAEKNGNFAFVELQQEQGYRTETPADESAVVQRLTQLRQAIQQKRLQDVTFQQFSALAFDRHLYQPLIALGRGAVVKVTPHALNEGEGRFVRDLKAFYTQNANLFAERELYLLRNQSRGRGLGFFQAGNFYPDFILWLLAREDGVEQQSINFIDPKGLLHLGSLSHPKIAFRQTIKEIETRLGDPTVTLNSFIISVTERARIPWLDPNLTLNELAGHHLLFQEEMGYVERLMGLTIL